MPEAQIFLQFNDTSGIKATGSSNMWLLQSRQCGFCFYFLRFKTGRSQTEAHTDLLALIGTVASWLVHPSPKGVVRVRTIVGDILAYCGSTRSTSDSQNLAVVTKRQDNSLFRRS